MCADTPPPVADAYSPHATYATLEGVHGDSHHYTQSSSFDSMFPGIDTKVAGFRSPPCDKAPSPTNFETYLPQHFSLYEGRVDQVYSPNGKPEIESQGVLIILTPCSSGFSGI